MTYKQKDRLSAGVTWIVVMDSSRARIFSRAKRFSDLRPVEVLEEPDARTRERELVSDRPGRSFDSHGSGRHAMGSDSSTKDEILEEFARRIAHRIEAGRISGDFRHLILVAAPVLLGAIRPILSHSSRQLIVGEVSKNLAHHEAADIQKILDRELG
jgi:protein required for attachment to host cells